MTGPIFVPPPSKRNQKQSEKEGFDRPAGRLWTPLLKGHLARTEHAGAGELEAAGSRAAPARRGASPPEHGGAFAAGDARGSGARARSRRNGQSPQNPVSAGPERAVAAVSDGPCQYKDKWPGPLADHREGSPRRGPGPGRQGGTTLPTGQSSNRALRCEVGPLRAVCGRQVEVDARRGGTCRR